MFALELVAHALLGYIVGKECKERGKSLSLALFICIVASIALSAFFRMTVG